MNFAAVIHVSLDRRRRKLVAVIKAEHFLQQPWLKDGAAICLEGGVKFHVTPDGDILRGVIDIPGHAAVNFYGKPDDIIENIEIVTMSMYARQLAGTP